MTNQFNPYDCRTCGGNWWEERFHGADTRSEEQEPRTRPLDDEVENIPRITRHVRPTGKIFQLHNDETPEEHYLTVSRAMYVEYTRDNDSITAQRMNTTPEQMQEILSAGPSHYIGDFSLPPRPVGKQYQTTYRKAYVRKL
jgi:hypothetical protein